jgi:hypothetical protein
LSSSKPMLNKRRRIQHQAKEDFGRALVPKTRLKKTRQAKFKAQSSG